MTTTEKFTTTPDTTTVASKPAAATKVNRVLGAKVLSRPAPAAVEAVKTATKKTASKATAKTPSKSPAKPVAKAAAPAKKKAITQVVAAKAKNAKVAKPAKAEKPKKPKMVRDSMTMPKDEYAVLSVLKSRAAKLTQPAKKTELLRAGIKALAAMSDASFLAALRAVPSLKTGRPSKS